MNAENIFSNNLYILHFEIFSFRLVAKELQKNRSGDFEYSEYSNLKDVTSGRHGIFMMIVANPICKIGDHCHLTD